MKEAPSLTSPPLPKVEEALARARDYLLKSQAEEGYWVGEMEADVSVTAGYIPLLHFLGLSNPRRFNTITALLKARQLEDGGWPLYWGGEGDLNVSIQAYFALKLAGVSEREPFMVRARDFSLSQGGIPGAHTFTKILLALFGQVPWGELPTLPPELLFLPSRVPLNIYDFASWARATIVALTILFALRPVCPIPPGASLRELYPTRQGRPVKKGKNSPVSWGFLALDRALKLWERLPQKPGRSKALRLAEEWVLAHQEADGSWGGIMLPWVYSLIALKSRGYPLEHPALARGIAGLEDFLVEDEDGLRLQPATSPIWDTGLAITALLDAGLPPDHPSLAKAGRWLLSQQVLSKGDWQVKNPRTPPGGWPFEFHNRFYPDIDDTAVVAWALQRLHLPEGEAKAKAIQGGLNWALAMQCRNGGWAAFDRDNNSKLIGHIPFADFMTPLDPSSLDVTAHMLELLGWLGYRPSFIPLARALKYLRREQEGDGAWFGRWGVNYLYGTGMVLPALKAAGEDMEQEYVKKAVAWLKKCQNGDGGWGETCRSYEDPSLRGIGPSTPSQTAWALLGLLAGGEGESSAVLQGIRVLLERQHLDGAWEEEAFTGGGFPGAFYLRYHLYPQYFPLMALGRYQAFLKGEANYGRTG